MLLSYVELYQLISPLARSILDVAGYIFPVRSLKVFDQQGRNWHVAR